MIEKSEKDYSGFDVSKDKLDSDLNNNLYQPFKYMKDMLPDLAVPGIEIVDDVGISKEHQPRGTHFDENYLDIEDKPNQESE